MSETPPRASAITREALIAEEAVVAVRAWAAAHGAPPTRSEWAAARQEPDTPLVVSTFGSWAVAVTAAGLRSWTRESVVDAIRHFTRLYGDPPRMRDFSPYHARWHREEWRAARFEAIPGRWPNSRMVTQRFGTWRAALEAAGEEIRPTELKRRWTEASIVEAIQRFTAERGASPRERDFAGADMPCADVVRASFGSLPVALAAAGVAPTMGNKQWTEARIVAAIRAWTSELGKPPSKKQWASAEAASLPRTLIGVGVQRAPLPSGVWEQPGLWVGPPVRAGSRPAGPWPNTETVKAAFGSWGAALEAAGVAR